MKENLNEQAMEEMKGRIFSLSYTRRRMVRNKIAALTGQGARAPKLAVIQVGDNPAGEVYVRNKMKACREAGIRDETVRLPADAGTGEVVDAIRELNLDGTVDAIMVQLPLPGSLDAGEIISAVAPEKDVDGLHPYNLGRLYSGSEPFAVPCTAKGVMSILRDITGGEPHGCLAGKNAVVIGRSAEVGMPVAKMLQDRDMTVTVCHSKTRGLIDITRRADVIVCAVGRPGFLKDYMVKEGAIVIDVGTSIVDGKVCGDVDYGSVSGVTDKVTPVPGGCGVMTVTSLLENIFELYSEEFCNQK